MGRLSAIKVQLELELELIYQKCVTMVVLEKTV